MRCRNKLSVFVLSLGCLLLSACELWEYHPYDGRIKGTVHLTAAQLAKLDNLQLGSDFKFVFLSDTQRHYDETEQVVGRINRMPEVDFVIHGGDLTDFGVTEEFEWMRDCLCQLQKPWLTVIGNHDFLGNGEHIYSEMFGPYNYAFTVGKVRFEMLNTVALELDYSTPVPDFGFLEDEIHYIEEVNQQHPDSLVRTIFIMHSRPKDEQFNNNVLLPFDRYLQMFPNPVCFNGHNHRRETLEPFDDGILFHGIGSMKEREFYVVSVTSGHYELETVAF